MRNKMQIFNNPEFGRIRVVLNEENEPLFAAVDIAKTLGYENPAEAIATHCKSGDIEKRYVAHQNRLGGTNIQFIKEFSVYRLIMRSKLPDAEKFQDWVCEEVLPSIRKHGGYILTNKEDTPDLIMARALQLADKTIKEYQQKEMILEDKVAIQKAELQKQAPKARYFDEVLQSESTYNTNQIAKELGMSAVTLNRKLQDLKVQYKQNGTWLLFFKYQDKGFTKTKTHTYTNTEGETKTSMQTVWTEKGRKFIHDLLKEQKVA